MYSSVEGGVSASILRFPLTELAAPLEEEEEEEAAAALLDSMIRARFEWFELVIDGTLIDYHKFKCLAACKDWKRELLPFVFTTKTL